MLLFECPDSREPLQSTFVVLRAVIGGLLSARFSSGQIFLGFLLKILRAVCHTVFLCPFPQHSLNSPFPAPLPESPHTGTLNYARS